MFKSFTNSYYSLFFILLSFNLLGQTTGEITYKGIVNQKFVDSFVTNIKEKKIPMATKQDMISKLNAAQPEEFILKFKDQESYYEKKPELDKQGFNLGSRADLVPYYTNNKTKAVIEMNQYLGYIAHKPIDWEITNETRTIGDYECRKAKTTEKLYSRQGNYYDNNIIAWFTSEIPVSFGPQNYSGLPGLILQIEDKEFTLTAVKINLNPNKNIKIKRLEEYDRVITQEESYNRIKELENDREKRMSNNN